MAPSGFAPPHQPRAAGAVRASRGLETPRFPRRTRASRGARRPRASRSARARRPRTPGVTGPRTSRNGCATGKGYERPGRYVPSNDATVTNCVRHETPRVSTRARGVRRERTGHQRRDCRARDYRRGLSPYNTTSPTRHPESFSDRLARARPPVTTNPTTPRTREAPPANRSRRTAPGVGRRE